MRSRTGAEADAKMLSNQSRMQPNATSFSFSHFHYGEPPCNVKSFNPMPLSIRFRIVLNTQNCTSSRFSPLVYACNTILFSSTLQIWVLLRKTSYSRQMFLLVINLDSCGLFNNLKIMNEARQLQK